MDIGSIISIIAGMMGGLGGGGSSSGSGGNLQLQQQMGEMLNEQRMRMRLQNPLYEETQQLMRALMPRSSKPASYVLPGSVSVNPAPLPDPNEPGPGPTPPGAPQANPLSQAVSMLASGIRPTSQATLFRR